MKEFLKEEINFSIDENIKYIKSVFADVSDIVQREFTVGDKKGFLVYIDGMADKIILNAFIMENVVLYEAPTINLDKLKSDLTAVADIKEEKNMQNCINAIMCGDTVLFINSADFGYVIASRSWPARGTSEPSGETVIRGGRDGFTETVRFNTALIRRRIKDTRLKVVSRKLGVRSKTDCAVMYIEDIADKEIINNLNSRLDKINIDAILDSGYVEQLIEDNKWSVFPQIQSTERPDVVAAALYEGRVAIVVDNSPFVLIVPAVLGNFFQSPDDYYQKWIFAAITRIIRFISIFLCLTLPALYVAITSFNTTIIPSKLAYSIAATREGVPFPAFVEAIIMEFSLALLTEAIIRLPKPIGSTIGIVGGLVIGQAAVSAGIVSPIMIIIISLTTITSFTTPNYSITMAFRVIRIALIILASLMGLYGIMIGVLIVMCHLVRLKSFGIPYLAPFTNPNLNDLKDSIIRVPLSFIKRRPSFMNTGDKIRNR